MAREGDKGMRGRLAGAIALAVLLGGGARASAEAHPVIGEIVWYQTGAYCTFQRAEQAFTYDDPETWRFLFITELVQEGGITVERGYMRLDGVLREMEFLGRDSTDYGEIRRYRTFGPLPVTVTIDMTSGESGPEDTPYFGKIVAERAGLETEVAFKGDCGV